MEKIDSARIEVTGCGEKAAGHDARSEACIQKPCIEAAIIEYLSELLI